MKVCIIIPMYNEEAVARLSLETILEYTRNLPPIVKILVVNDGSRDSTENVVQRLINGLQKDEVTLISHTLNQGYGAALRTGIRFALDRGYDYVLFMDSDLTNHPKYLRVFYERMLEGWDYIKATRYARGGGTVGVPWRYKIISIIGNSFARLLYRLPLTDLTNGFRAAKVDVMKKMALRESGFAIIMEELYYARHCAKSFCEIPYVLTSRKKGHGKTQLSRGPRAILQYLKYPLRSYIESMRRANKA